MDISVAVVRLKMRPNQDIRSFCAPDSFDVLVLKDKDSVALPKKRIESNFDTLGEALKVARRLAGASIFRRAVPIPIQTDLHSAECPSTSSATTSSSLSVSYTTLFCVPVTDEDLKGVTFSSNYSFSNLSTLVNDALNVAGNMDGETVHFIERIESWLSSLQKGAVDVLHRLFMLKSIASRLRTCIHNPAANPEFYQSCLLAKLDHQVDPLKRRKTCPDVEEAVKKSNEVRVQMMQMEKYDIYLINPVFNVPLDDVSLPDYFAKGKMGAGRHKKVADQKRPTELMATYYPLHKAAMDGDAQSVQALLDKGYDPNLFDSYTWAPLHYCAFYGHLDVAEVLMSSSVTDVNLVNKFGDTALHFAALNGFSNLTQLILSSVKARRDLRNKDGLTALEVCRGPALIAFKNTINHDKGKNLEVHYGDRDLLHMRADDKTTTRDLKMMVFTELRIGKECEKLFAIWIVGDRLSLQLGDDQKVQQQLIRYPDYLKKWGEDLSLGRPGVSPDDTPKVMFRRKAVSYIETEMELCPNNAEVLQLLFDEAVKNFLSGNLPYEKEAYTLAAILFVMKFGDSALEELMFSQILPAYLIQEKMVKALMSKIEAGVKIVRGDVGNRYKLKFSFLKICWASKSYGCTWFKATMHSHKPTKGTVNVRFGINDYGICVVNLNTHRLIFALRHREFLEDKMVASENKIHINSRNDLYEFQLSTKSSTNIENLLKKWQSERKRHFDRQEKYQRSVESSNVKQQQQQSDAKITGEKKSQSSSIFRKLILPK